ncbi:O-acyltransferase like protein-like [Bicyclus anynana]|uniref:O-acyltransferase like protein-like n=1 Tax=Bicyclus anynana TaxID=110368 RepID=A0A6J1NBD8_BICAN|nr:O-acyltransferase like protein-like [Bicyclus anynana]
MVTLCRIGLCILFIGAINAQDQDSVHASREIVVHTNTKTKKLQRISLVDLFIEDLTEQQWAKDEIVCSRKVLKILHNVKNSTLWATWIWDSMQSPIGIFYGSRYQFGSYDQCMKAPWLETHSEYRTKYCLADIKLSNEEQQETVIVDPHSSVKTYLNSRSKYGLTFSVITSGVCVPVECNSKAISKIVQSLFKQSHLGLTMPIAEVTINPCEVSGVQMEYSKEFHFVMYGLVLIAAATIICTILNTYLNHHIRTNVGNKIIKAFCINENINSLWKMNDDDLASLNGIRCVVGALVVILHVWFFNNFIGSINHLDVDKDYEKYDLNSLSHASLVVDNYLMISGLLLMKGLMLEKYNPFVTLLKRYLRFIWTLAVLLAISIHVVPHIADGPIWHKIMQPQIDNCKKNWWITALMLGNYVDTANICYPVLWTVPCDFHLSIVGILLFTLYKRHRRIGFAAFAILFIASIILPGVVTYQNRLPAVPILDISGFKDYRNHMLDSPTYMQSHLRAGPYLVGVAMGYLISIYKLDKRKNIISPTYSLIGFVVSFGIALKIVAIGGIFLDKSRPYNVWEATLFASCNRSLYAIGIACLVAFCEYGAVPAISVILKSEVFVALSKLSYGTYLLHMILYCKAVASTRTPLNHSMYLLFFNASGLFTYCSTVSLFFHLLFEAPMRKILNIIFQTKINKNDSEMKVHECNNGVSSKQKKTL